MVFKLKLWTSDDDKTVLKDCYFDTSKITGFFIPTKAAQDEHIEGEAINLFFDGDMITVSQEKHIVDYLTENFVNPSISETQYLKKANGSKTQM